MTATEKIYIHGAIGDSVGYQVIDLKTGLSAQDDNDRLIISDFDKSLVIKYGGQEKKMSELFKVKRNEKYCNFRCPRFWKRHSK